jgi:hypothetical protein
MAQTVLGAAAFYLILGSLAYALTLSGRRVGYIAPVSVESEAGIGLLFLWASAVVLVASAAAVLISGWPGTVIGLALGAGLVAGTARRLLRRWRSDVARVHARCDARQRRRG